MDLLQVSLGFYRRFGTPNQFRVYSKDEIIQNIKKYNGNRDCFISLSEHYIDKSGYELTIPLFMVMDFDIINGYTLWDVKKDSLKVRDWLKEEGYEYHYNVSGSKGFHLLVPLTRVIPATNEQLINFYDFITHKFDLPTLDRKCFEVMRIIRIPGTLNIKGNKLCTEIEHSNGKIMNLFEYSTTSYQAPNSKNLNGTKDVFYFPFPWEAPCIFSRINNTDVDHTVRWIWVKLLKAQGYTDKEIYDKAMNMSWTDLNSNITKYQIVKTQDYPATISCKYIKSLGLCLNKRCPFR